MLSNLVTGLQFPGSRVVKKEQDLDNRVVRVKQDNRNVKLEQELQKREFPVEAKAGQQGGQAVPGTGATQQGWSRDRKRSFNKP